MEDDCLPRRPIAPDVRELNQEVIPADIEGVVAGFPCTSVSQAGGQQGLAGPSGLVREVWRIVDLTDASFVFLENVNALRFFEEVWRSIFDALWSRGFQMHWVTVSGENVGVRQRRRRFFLLATRGRCDRGGPFCPPRFSPERILERVCDLDAILERERDAAFNPPGMPPMSRWFSTREDFDEGRIQMLGDTVIPHQALLAASLFARP